MITRVDLDRGMTLDKLLASKTGAIIRQNRQVPRTQISEGRNTDL